MVVMFRMASVPAHHKEGAEEENNQENKEGITVVEAENR